MQVFLLSLMISFTACQSEDPMDEGLVLHQNGYLSKRGLDVFVFNNWYNGYFSDSKMSGIELIHHGIRTVTNGDVRLEPTPEQWDAIPEFGGRLIDTLNLNITAKLSYPVYHFTYSIEVKPLDEGFSISVILDDPLPAELAGKAGFNLEFLPSAYMNRTYLADSSSGVFPVYPGGPVGSSADGLNPLPLAQGKRLVFAPDDPERMITVESDDLLSLYDGRNAAQNGWFVLRSLIPENKTGEVLSWKVIPETIAGWVRKPVIGHSQAGYTPGEMKRAVIERDPNDKSMKWAELYRIDNSGKAVSVLEERPEPWGSYLRYTYFIFDFSSISREGIYFIQYGNVKSQPFLISRDIYKHAWEPTLDQFIPVQMDHMFVNEAYRVWHGAAHLDDARQAPPGHVHFDLFAQGP
ncbi:MAG: glycoside hydrolase, partial [Bacteroidota bacterium]